MHAVAAHHVIQPPCLKAKEFILVQSGHSQKLTENYAVIERGKMQ